MKKIISILLAALIVATLAACNANKTNVTLDHGKENPTETTLYENVDLAAVADSLYEGLAEDQRPVTLSIPLDAETFEDFAFIPYQEGLEAVVNEPMIGSIAHSVVLVKCADAATAEKVAAEMKENCNPGKWICVESDVVKTVTNKNIAMLLMTTTEGGMADTILGNFEKFDGKTAEVATETTDELFKDEVVEKNEVIENDTGIEEILRPKGRGEAGFNLNEAALLEA